jgi:alpha-galactosidase
VLIIKTAWGGRSLNKNFRPPSSPLDAAALQEELAKAQEAVRKSNEKHHKDAPLPTIEDIRSGYGDCYRDMLAEVKDVLANYGTLFPQLAGRNLELAGLVWFHGWNDQYGGAEKQYETNMKNFIGDVRRELGAPQLPVVIAVMGQNGSTPATGAMKVIQDAQLAMQEVPEFQGNVKAFRTDVLVDTRAEKLVQGWQDHLEEWNKTGSDYGYHYYGSAIWYTRIGRAMGEAMLQLLGEKR